MTSYETAIGEKYAAARGAIRDLETRVRELIEQRDRWRIAAHTWFAALCTLAACWLVREVGRG